MQVYDCNGTPAQNWVWNEADTKIRLADSNFCLDAGTNPASGVGMKIWTSVPRPLHFGSSFGFSLTSTGPPAAMITSPRRHGIVRLFFAKLPPFPISTQLISFLRPPAPLYYAGTADLRFAVTGKGRCLDVPNGNVANLNRFVLVCIAPAYHSAFRADIPTGLAWAAPLVS